MNVADYIVVGAGPAGCALANRLVNSKNAPKVILIEAGKRKPSIFSVMPAGLALLVRSKGEYNYGYETVPQEHLNNRRGFVPRGRGVGGSSLINAMIYTRGQKEDYDEWAQMGCHGWSWQDVLPLFKRAETNSRGNSEFHGDQGPLQVSDQVNPNPLSYDFIHAANQCQYHTNHDFNGKSQEGVGLYQVYQKGGRRIDAGTAYLEELENHPNLKVISDAPVKKILFEDNQAIGISIKTQFGDKILLAKREIILSCGAINTPQLLMVSGIGPAQHLKDNGIHIVKDSPNVGKNLQDHIDYTANMKMHGKGLLSFGFAGVKNVTLGLFPYLSGRGFLTTNVAEAGGFIKSNPDLDRPDLQLHFCTSMVDDHARKIYLSTGIALHVCVLRPKSRGEITLSDNNPLSAPVINPNFLDDDYDMETLVKGAKIVHKILKSPPLAKYRGKMLYGNLDADDVEIRDLIRAHSDTIYHPVGTCAMGASEDTVLDYQLKVRGIKGLRVADASIMPTLISGNTQAPSAMIGEKAADLILSQ